MGRNDTYWRRKEAHQCVRCGMQLQQDETAVRCELCKLADNRRSVEYNKRRRDKLEAETGRRTSRDRSDYCKRRAEELKAKKLCVRCGRFPSRPMRTTCEMCGSVCADRQAVRYMKLVAEHRCFNCAKPLPDRYKPRACAECIERINASKRVKEKQHG